MPEKLDRCVNKVKGQKGVDSAYAICNATISELAKDGRDIYNQHLKEMDVPHLLQEHHSPLDIVSGESKDKHAEAVAIPGELSTLSIGDKREKEIGIILGAQR